MAPILWGDVCSNHTTSPRGKVKEGVQWEGGHPQRTKPHNNVPFFWIIDLYRSRVTLPPCPWQGKYEVVNNTITYFYLNGVDGGDKATTRALTTTTRERMVPSPASQASVRGQTSLSKHQNKNGKNAVWPGVRGWTKSAIPFFRHGRGVHRGKN